MNFARFFIDRPVFAIVLSLVTIIAGVLAMINLPVTQYPEIIPPTVTVYTTYPGADAQTVSNTVAAPIEQQVNGVENMLYMSSQAGNDGSYRLTVTFKLGTNLDIAQVQVQNRVAIAQPQLPADVQRIGVTVRKASPDITLVVNLVSPDNRYDTLYISNYAYLQVQDQIARVQGVGDVTIFGQRDYSMRLWLNPDQLQSRGLTVDDVTAAVREQNVQVAAGVVGGQPIPVRTSAFELTVNVLGRLTDPEQFGRIVVKTGEDGRITYLRDIARIELGAYNYTTTTFLNGKPAVGIAVFQLPGSNSIETANLLYERMKELKRSFPPGLDYVIPYDTTRFVRESVQDVVTTLLEAIGLVVLVVIVFLQSWRASLIPLLAIPVSLIGTFAVMKALGFTVNNLSLFGVVLAIGIVVDDAIVVVENVHRWLDQGYEPHEAARHAMREVTAAVIAIAFGLSAIFIPTAFISGITGQFYRQFALTISASTLLSAFNSLTLSPALAALLLRPHEARPDALQRFLNMTVGWFFNLFNKALGWVTNFYARLVRFTLRIPWLVLLAYVGFLVLAYFLFNRVPTGFIPQQDTGYLLVNLQLPDAASTNRTIETMRKLIDIAGKTPGVQNTFAVTGYSFFTGVNQPNVASMFVVMRAFSERAGHPDQTSGAILAKLSREYGQIQDGMAQVFPPPPVRGLSNAGGFKLIVEDRSGRRTPREIQEATDNVIAAASKHPELQSLFTSFRANVPQLFVRIDRAKAKTENVPVTSIFDTLQTYLGSFYINDFNYLGRVYRVVAQAEAPYRVTASDIVKLRTRNLSGGMVPLGSVVDVESTTGPSRMQRYNLYPAAEINGATAPGVATGQMIDIMDRTAGETLPPDMGYEWTELTYQQILAGNTAVYIFPLCVLFVWLTHSAEYESFALSTAIILIIPMCLLAGIAGVWLRGMDNNIFTQIGFVVLAGLSAKNAVLIVEFAKQQQEHGKDAREAAVEASHLRLRPILMTSFAFILGVLPLLRAHGAGAEMRQAIGTAVFYGMIGVTLFGLLMTPTFYYVIRRITERFGRRRGGFREPPPGPPEPPVGPPPPEPVRV